MLRRLPEKIVQWLPPYQSLARRQQGRTLTNLSNLAIHTSQHSEKNDVNLYCALSQTKGKKRKNDHHCEKFQINLVSAKSYSITPTTASQQITIKTSKDCQIQHIHNHYQNSSYPQSVTSVMVAHITDDGRLPAHHLRWLVIVPFKVCRLFYTDGFLSKLFSYLFKG